MHNFEKIREEIISKAIARAHNVSLYAEELGCNEDDLVQYLESQGVRECPACGKFKATRHFPLSEVMCDNCRDD